MSEAIIVAIIGAAAVIIAAIIGLLKKINGNKTIIRQQANGKNIQQIGLQIEKRKERGKIE